MKFIFNKLLISAAALIFFTAFSFFVRNLLTMTAQPLSAQNLQFDEQQATIQAIKKVDPTVVNITVLQNKAGLTTEEGSGTGFLISADGLIITNRHVVNTAEDKYAEYKIALSSGKGYYAQLIGKDPLDDIALLKIFDKNLPHVELGDSSQLAQGASVIAIGNALGIYQNTATKGIVSGLNRDVVASDQSGNAENLGDVIQTDAEINLGNSGGPLIDLNGKVVGVNVAVDTSGASIGFAIPINDVMPVITSALSNGRIIRPKLGISYLMITPAIANDKKLARASGAWINSVQTSTPAVTPGSPADKAGLKDGDIIFQVNGTNIDANNTLLSVTQKYKPGNKITLKVQRGTKVFEVSVVLDEFK